MKLPLIINEYLQSLLRRFDNIYAIWLIGSRVNDGARPDSDWDFLIFADEQVYAQLKEHGPKPPKDVSIMVVIDKDRFISPWERKSDGCYEKGSLSGWRWTSISEDKAKYKGCKEQPDGSTRTRWENAIRLFKQE